jgi:hypothetical protein
MFIDKYVLTIFSRFPSFIINHHRNVIKLIVIMLKDELICVKYPLVISPNIHFYVHFPL